MRFSIICPKKRTKPDVLGAHLESVLDKLWSSWQKR